MNQRLYWWLEANNILDIHQAEFQRGHRTDDQLFRLTQKIIDGFHEKKSTTAVFVDLKQAYDRVWRKGLLLQARRLAAELRRVQLAADAARQAEACEPRGEAARRKGAQHDRAAG